MSNWIKWIWPGVITCAILSFLAVYMKADFIEADLTQRAQTVLGEKGHGWAKVEMDGRDATILGSAPSETAQDEAGNLALNAYDVRVVANKSELLAVQSPYTLKAVKTGKAVELTGFVPDEKTREQVTEAVKKSIPDSEITDSLSLARGAPDTYGALSSFGFEQLAGLDSGEFLTSDQAFSIKGSAATREAYDAINSAVADNLPQGAQLSMNEVTAPAESPYSWSAQLDGDTLNLSGFVPSKDAGDAIKQAAQEVLPNVKIEDNQLVAPGEPAGFEGYAKFSLGQLPRFTQGKVSLLDSALSVQGAASSVSNYTQSIASIAAGALPTGLSLANSDITPATAPQYEWGAALESGKVSLTGLVPNEGTREQINAKAKSLFSGAAVEDSMQIASGAPEAFGNKTGFALDQLQRFSSGSVALNNSELSIRGVAKDATLYESAREATNNLPSDLVLGSVNISPPTMSPYTWSAVHDGKTVTLSGYAPSIEARQSVKATLKKALPDFEVKDEMLIAQGAPERFLDAARFSANQLNRFSEGSVALSDRTLAISGAAKTIGDYNASQAALSGRLPADLTLASQNITSPSVSPYVWGAEYNGQTVDLTGYVPDQDTRNSILGAVNDALPEAQVSDQMRVAQGAPSGFGDAAQFAARQLGRFNNGSVKLSDLDFSVQGAAKDVAAYQGAKEAIGGEIPAGLKIVGEEITSATVSPYTWNAQLSGQTVNLGGYIPNNDARQSVIDTVSKVLPGKTIKDNMLIASGAAENFLDATEFSTKQLKRFKSGDVSLSDSSISISGVAKDPQNYTVAKAVANGTLPAGLTLNSENISAATVAPYVWNAKKDGEQLVMTGYVPDDAARNEVVSRAKAAIPSAQIQDNMLIAAGAPDNFVEATAFAANQLNLLSEGSAGLSDSNFAIRGVASSTQNFVDVNDAVGGDLPAGLRLASKDISPPTITPYSWSANYDGQSVTLGGFAPSLAAKNQISGDVAAQLPGIRVVDQMQIAAGAPTTHVEAATSAVSILPRFSKGSVALSGLNLTVIGTGKTSQDYLAAEKEADAGFAGGVKVASADIKPPANEGDYVWNAAKQSETVVLSGSVPSKQVSANIERQAKELNPGLSVENRMSIESGAPAGFEANAVKGLSLLDGLSNGAASINNQNLNVSGNARTVNSYETLEGLTSGELSDGFNWGERNIAPPVITPYSWSVDNSGPEVLISGFVPNRGIGNTNVAAAQAVLSKPVMNAQRIAAGEPEGFGNAAASLIGSVEQLENSRATITGTSAFLQGRASSESEAERIGNLAEANLPKNYKLRKQISYPLPKAVDDGQPKDAPKPAAKVCEVDFASLFEGQKIQFDTARAVIKPESFNLLNRIADGLKECADSKIEIGGHTDSRGSESYNQGLSEARARAVYVYMVEKAGVSGENLVAKGYGETSPIASNQTVAERTKNRRIEFKVLGQN